MPFTFLAHQAAVIPLKLARPSWFDGTALVLGSLLPDCEYAWQEIPEAGWAHTPEGVLFFVLPAGLVLSWLVRRVIAGPLAAHLPDGPRFRLRDYAALETAPRGFLALVRAAAGVLVGAATHVVWDACTHAGTFVSSGVAWLETPLVTVSGFPIRTTGVFQIVSSAGGVLVSLALLHAIARRRAVLAWAGLSAGSATGASATPASRRALLAPVVATTLAGVVWALLCLRAPTLYVFLSLCVRGLFRTVGLAFVGLLVGCLLARGRLAAAPAGA